VKGALGLRLAWIPGRVTVVVLFLATLAGAWLLSPVWWNSLGNDSRVFYSAASVADAGGNPYDFHLLRAEEARVNQAAPASQRQAFGPAPYAYPPLMTALYTLLLPLGERGFYFASAAILLGALAVAFLLTAAGTGWANLRIGAWALLVSAPSILGLVAGNPSNLLFLAWAAGFYCLARGRPILAGAVLAMALVKPPIALALAAAMMLASPAVAVPLLLGFGAGTALFLGANLLLAGPGAMSNWVDSLVGFAGTINVSGSPNQQCCLAGLPALLMDHAPTLVAVGAALLVVAAVLGAGVRSPAAREDVADNWLLRVALLTAAALAASPYVHLNDLVLETLPVMVVASRRVNPVTVTALLAWGLGSSLALVLSVVLAVVLHGQVTSAVGYGVLLTALTLVALASTLRPALGRAQQPLGPPPSS
jgi:hypothetical protein